MNTLKEAFLYEVGSISHSWYKIALVSLLPLLCFALIISIFRSGVVRDMPVAVVDKDHSQLSRKLLAEIDANEAMKIAAMSQSTKDAIESVKRCATYAAIVIPKNFEKDILLQKNPKITAFINTQYILIGKILTAELTATVLKSAAQLEYIKGLIDAKNPYESLQALAPIKLQITPFFNTYKNYFYFLVSALIPAIWQIFIVIASLVAIGVVFKEGKEYQLFKKNRSVAVTLMGIMLPYTLLFTLVGVLFEMYLYSMWEFQGSFIVLIVGIVLTTVAYQAVALLFFSAGFDYARSLSLGAVYTAPAFAFLGITFPIYNMNDFALFWRDMLPISHYLQLQISQANYGADPILELKKLFFITLFWLVFIPVVFRFEQRLAVRA